MREQGTSLGKELGVLAVRCLSGVLFIPGEDG